MDVEKLIHLIEERPYLWNKRDAFYVNRTRRDKGWSEIAHEIYGQQWASGSKKEKQELVERLKSRWQTCRDQFKREMQMRSRSGDGRMPKRTYVYTEQLMFLKQVLDVGPTSDNLVAEDEASGSSQGNQEKEVPDSREEESMEAAENLDTSPAESVQICQRRRRENRNVVSTKSQIDSEVLAILKKRGEQKPNQLFCNSLAVALDSVPEEKRQRCYGTLLAVVETFSKHFDPDKLSKIADMFKYGDTPTIATPTQTLYTPSPNHHPPIQRYPPRPTSQHSHEWYTPPNSQDWACRSPQNTPQPAEHASSTPYSQDLFEV
ncbi:uncharacterized protein [Dendropsophus ebraccatus]|uniref:uncharacterized protein n=1 Tax=Dendropsophus ebraccatus TaxID=150705 RepID=UPI00383207A2